MKTNYSILENQQNTEIEKNILELSQCYQIDGNLIHIYKFNRIKRDEKVLSFHKILERFQNWIQHQKKTIEYLDENQTSQLIQYTKQHEKIFTARVFILNHDFMNREASSSIVGFSRYSDMTLSFHKFLHTSSKDIPKTGYIACIVKDTHTE